MVLSWNKGKWLHSHETLLNSKVTYIVKLVGVVEVSDSRGMEVVKEALQKLKFSRHIKRSEGTKPPKVEITINIQGMKICNPRTKEVLHDIKLHHVSFCAEDKEDKRMFTFIAKGPDGKHFCYGLDSLHEANDITLTIGQAFELAYDRYLKTDRGMATSKQVMELNKRIEQLEKENTTLKQTISGLTQKANRKPTAIDAVSQQTPQVEQDKPSSSGLKTSQSVDYQRLDPRSLATSEPFSKSEEQLTSSNLLTTLFQDNALSHSPNNKRYLQAKIGSSSAEGSGRRRLQKQAYIDQTIASVERAKASLKNLKDYVHQRKLRKKQRSNSDTSVGPKVKQSRQVTSVDDEDINYAKISDISDVVKDYKASLKREISSLKKPDSKPPTPTKSRQAIKRQSAVTSLPAIPVEKKNSNQQLVRRNSANSLYTGFDEVISTLKTMMVSDESTKSKTLPKDQKIEMKTDVKKQPNEGVPVHPMNLPETIIDDSACIAGTQNYINVPYASIQSKYKHLWKRSEDGSTTPPALPPRDHPLIPPKPKHLLQLDDASFKSSSMGSLNFSVTSSELSASTDRHGDHAYSFDSPDDSIYMNKTTPVPPPAIPEAINKIQEEPIRINPLYKVNETSGRQNVPRKRYSNPGKVYSTGASDKKRSSAVETESVGPTGKSNPKKMVLDSTLERYSGQDGYLLLKEASKVAQSYLQSDDGTDNIDSTYDNVYNLMKSVRKDAREASRLKEQSYRSQYTSNAAENLASADVLDARDLIEILQQAERLDSKASKAPVMRLRDSGSNSLQGSSKQLASVLLKPLPSVNAQPTPPRDAFDMRPFNGTKSTGESPVVRLPSPDEVHPKTPHRRRSMAKKQEDLARQLFDDPLGELTKLDEQLQPNETGTDYENHSEIFRKIMRSSKLSSLLQQHVADEGHVQGQTAEQVQSFFNPLIDVEGNTSNENNTDSQENKYQRRLKMREEGYLQPSMMVDETDVSLDAFDPLKSLI